MRRAAVVAVTVAMLVGLTACSSDDEKSTPTPSATASGPSDDEVAAKIAADAPPKDVVWANPEKPSGWTVLGTEQGVSQWQVDGTACVVGLSQPAGVGTAKSPTGEELADRQVQQIASAVGGTEDLDFTDTDVKVSATVTGSSAKVRQDFVQRTFTAGDEVGGVVRARRYGDFALIAYSACGSGDFEQAYAGGVKDFLDSLTVTLTY